MLLAAFLLGFTLRTSGQVSNNKLKNQLEGYFKTYNNPHIENNLKYGIQSVLTSESKQIVEVYANEVFGMQPFTTNLVEQIYKDIKEKLPAPYNSYNLSVYADKKEIHELVTAAWTHKLSEGRYWRDVDYQGFPWIKNISIPFYPSQGLQGRHISLWASHGFYYANGDHKWITQRPHLFCTTEDLLTQSIAVPFLYPMLERAGAIVFTPRERDWQRNEVVVDNDFPSENGQYEEYVGQYRWTTTKPGFTNIHKQLTDFDDPHHEGSARIVKSQNDKHDISTATWIPTIPEDGNYAVYVSYPILQNAVPDVQYIICHAGIETIIEVNQQMGGSTWVYLGTYDFTSGNETENRIQVSNYSTHDGFIGADAIRLGGGMSHVVRADIDKKIITQKQDTNTVNTFQIEAGSVVKPNGQIVPPRTGIIAHVDSLYQKTDTTVQILQYKYTNELIGSGLPRHLEASRYTTQWMGLQREQFGIKDGIYDYGDDINSRPIATNYLSRGSIYLPGDSGLCVPIEMNLALHSDAGYKRSMDYIGSLAIHTSAPDEGMMPGGLNRMTSRDLCDILLQQVTSDLSANYGKWTRRQIFDRNYGETRIPQIPSAILEMFSHQNYADLVRAFDPVFKFQISRSIYKGVLRFLTLQHDNSEETNPVVQPLPIHGFAAIADPINHNIRLTWQPTIDSLESSANPTAYILYTKTEGKGWDNGQVTEQNYFDFVPYDSALYQFKVEAINEGGRSLPSETLCARLSKRTDVPSILITNGFQRLAGPQTICNNDSCGFLLEKDPGVSYIQSTEFCGYQKYFGWDGIGKETSKGMGYSGTELEGKLIVGNTFDYPVVHAEDMMAFGDYNISSCSRHAIENGYVLAGAYQMLDLIMGAQRNDGYSTYKYKTFTPALQHILKEYTESGGSVLLSGAYIGTDMKTQDEQNFTQKVLHYHAAGEVNPDNGKTIIEGMGTLATYTMIPNDKHLSTAYLSCLAPDNRSFSTLLYQQSRQSAAIAYKGTDYACIVMGFPLEQLVENRVRRNLMSGFLDFLIKK